MNPNFPSNSAQKVANIWNNDYGLADEGNYFLVTNPTVGTAIAMTTSVVDDAATASSTHAQFAPALYIYNGDSPQNPSSSSIYLRYIRTTLVQVPTSATAWKYSFRMDQGNRYSSGGTALTPVNPNPNSTKQSKATVVFGAIVPTTLPNATARLLANGTIDTAIPVAGDQWLFTFGNSAPSMDQLNGGATAKNMVFNVPPIIIPPGWGLQWDMWGASNAAAPSWEFEIAWAERIPGL